MIIPDEIDRINCFLKGDRDEDGQINFPEFFLIVDELQRYYLSNREIAERNAREGSEAREDILKSEKFYQGNSLLSIFKSSFINSINHMNSNVSNLLQDENELENNSNNISIKHGNTNIHNIKTNNQSNNHSNNGIQSGIQSGSRSESEKIKKMNSKSSQESEYHKKVEMLLKRKYNDSDEDSNDNDNNNNDDDDDEVHEINDSNIDENVKFSVTTTIITTNNSNSNKYSNNSNNSLNNNNSLNKNSYTKTITINAQNRNGLRIESFPEMPVPSSSSSLI